MNFILRFYALCYHKTIQPNDFFITYDQKTTVVWDIGISLFVPREIHILPDNCISHRPPENNGVILLYFIVADPIHVTVIKLLWKRYYFTAIRHVIMIKHISWGE